MWLWLLLPANATTATLQDLIDQAVSGDTVEVRSGETCEALRIGTSGITLAGDGIDSTVLDGSCLTSEHLLEVLQNTVDVVVRDLTITAAPDVCAWVDDGATARFERVRFEGCVLSGVPEDSVDSHPAAALRVEYDATATCVGCEFVDNGHHPLVQAGAVRSNGHFVVSDSLFCRNVGDQRGAIHARGTGSLTLDTTRFVGNLGRIAGIEADVPATVVHNTFVLNVGQFDVYDHDDGGIGVFSNNIVAFNGDLASEGAVQGDPPPYDIFLEGSHNLYFGNNVDGDLLSEPRYLSDPLFAAADLLDAYGQPDCDADLSLTNGSPAIGVADPTFGLHDDLGAIDFVDGDGDGFDVDEDCDDTDASVHPEADEVCDFVDNDCDSLIDEADPDVTDALSVWVDADGDGFGADGDPTTVCAVPSGYAEQAGDCDDLRTDTHPGAPELCDELDNDCDNEVDEDTQLIDWFVDDDGDGFGTAGFDPVSSCEPVAGRASNALDCNDADPSVAPDQVESCNGVDDDCDGLIDNESPDAVLLYTDGDGDGFGVGSPLGQGCVAEPGQATMVGDCDDAAPSVFPGADELCNGVDDDCDTVVDDDAIDAAVIYADDDGDGHGGAAVDATCSPPSDALLTSDDCDDTDPDRSPSALEVCGDGFDQDCDGFDPPCSSSGPTSPSPTTDDGPPSASQRASVPDGLAPACGCHSAPVGGPSLLALAWLALSRRTRRRLRAQPPSAGCQAR
jgi:hypothetical protein